MIPEKKLKSWIDGDFNVLLVGKAGVGKSSIIKQCFDENKLNYLYFSGSTLDPWVDFVGIPKEKETKAEDGTTTSCIELVRPKYFAEDTVEAIFIDELNRSHAKIRNAVMELIQFKSINGKKFSKLRFVWAAINPDTEKDENENNVYDVERLDPALKDRFHVCYELPYSLDGNYFQNKFGSVGVVATKWWNGLDNKTKEGVSPRRLEYALEALNKKIDIRDILPKQTNVKSLLEQIQNGSYEEQFNKLFEEGKYEAIVSNDSLIQHNTKKIFGSQEILERVLFAIPAENFLSKLKSFTDSERKNIQTLFTKMTHPTAVVDEAKLEYIKNITESIKKSGLKEYNNLVLTLNNLVRSKSPQPTSGSATIATAGTQKMNKGHVAHVTNLCSQINRTYTMGGKMFLVKDLQAYMETFDINDPTTMQTYKNIFAEIVARFQNGTITSKDTLTTFFTKMVQMIDKTAVNGTITWNSGNSSYSNRRLNELRNPLLGI